MLTLLSAWPWYLPQSPAGEFGSFGVKTLDDFFCCFKEVLLLTNCWTILFDLLTAFDEEAAEVDLFFLTILLSWCYYIC